MKTGAEVIGEMILAGLRSKPKEEREELMEDLYGIKAQITLPNLNEAFYYSKVPQSVHQHLMNMVERARKYYKNT